MRCFASFTDADGAAVTPGGITFQYQAPDGSISSGSVTSLGGGRYYSDVLAAAPGQYQYRFASSSGYVTAGEGRFSVRPSVF